MAGPQEIPELVTELVGMSKEYLRQETLEPAKKLGRLAGFGIGAGAVFAFAAMFVVLGAYALFREVLPEGEWWLVLSRFLTVVVALAGVGILGWRMSKA
jgi:hypothetical protein